MKNLAVQDFYPDHFAHCYGCGHLNENGHQIKTVWEGEETVSFFTPKPYHTAIPGFVYGGLLASLIDCHGTGSAALALAREQNIKLKDQNAPRCVTASLHVDYQRPTPIGLPLEIRGTITEVKGKKIVIAIQLSAEGVVCVSGQVIAIQVSDDFGLI